MTPPQLTLLPLDNQAYSGVPVLLFWELQNNFRDGKYFHSGICYYAHFRWVWIVFEHGNWRQVGLLGVNEVPTGYIPLAIPIPGPPPKDMENSDGWKGTMEIKPEHVREIASWIEKRKTKGE